MFSSFRQNLNFLRWADKSTAGRLQPEVLFQALLGLVLSILPLSLAVALWFSVVRLGCSLGFSTLVSCGCQCLSRHPRLQASLLSPLALPGCPLGSSDLGVCSSVPTGSLRGIAHGNVCSLLFSFLLPGILALVSQLKVRQPKIPPFLLTLSTETPTGPRLPLSAGLCATLTPALDSAAALSGLPFPPDCGPSSSDCFDCSHISSLSLRGY